MKHEDVMGRWRAFGITQPESRLLFGDYHAATVWGNGTWHTWDRNGVGGENAEEPTEQAAKDAAVVALLRQGWHPLALRLASSSQEAARLREALESLLRDAVPAAGEWDDPVTTVEYSREEWQRCVRATEQARAALEGRSPE